MIVIELSLDMLEPEVADAIWATERRRAGLDPAPIGEYVYKPLKKRQQVGNDEYTRWLANGVNGSYDEHCEPAVAIAADHALESVLKAHYEQVARLRAEAA